MRSKYCTYNNVFHSFNSATINIQLHNFVIMLIGNEQKDRSKNLFNFTMDLQ